MTNSPAAVLEENAEIVTESEPSAVLHANNDAPAAELQAAIAQSQSSNDNLTAYIEEADYPRLCEALLFASERALAIKDLQAFFPAEFDLLPVLQELQAHYQNRGLQLVELGGKWSFRTAADLAPHLKRERTVQRKLSRATVETLAIIAYHQPVTRAEIEDIRGVAVAQGTLDILLQANWIKPGRRRETPGRPVTWITTDEFLQHFGIVELVDLPGFDELKAAGLLDKSRPSPGPLFQSPDEVAVDTGSPADDEEL